MKQLSRSEQSAPSVFPLLPCCGSLSSENKVTIGCLSSGYFPSPVDVKWNSGTITGGIKNFPAVLGKNGLYLSTSHLTISASDLKSKQFECNVEHKPTGAKITKKIPDCLVPSNPPKVKVMQASCGESGSVDLVCFINGYSPSEIQVQWLINGQPTDIAPLNSTPYKDNDGKFGSSSKVSVPKEDWSSGDRYTCRVNHPASSTKTEDSIQKCKESSGTHPKVVILPPSPKDMLITKVPRLTCVVSRMNSPNTLNIKWTRTDGKRAVEFTSEPEQGDDGLYIVRSVLKISIPDWESGTIFTCNVQHEELPSAVDKTIQKREVTTTDPDVYALQPSADELLAKDFATITCMLVGFYPEDIYVQWKKNGIPQSEEYYTNTAPILDEDQATYFMYSKLTIDKSDWIRGAQFTCSAVHSKITSKDIKKSNEYIIWNCNDEDDEDSLWSTAATFITLFLLSVFYSATITIVKVKWFISRILQFDKHDDHFIAALDTVTQ